MWLVECEVEQMSGALHNRDQQGLLWSFTLLFSWGLGEPTIDAPFVSLALWTHGLVWWWISMRCFCQFLVEESRTYRLWTAACRLTLLQGFHFAKHKQYVIYWLLLQNNSMAVSAEGEEIRRQVAQCSGPCIVVVHQGPQSVVWISRQAYRHARYSRGYGIRPH